jgi:hypothetical protein
MLRELMRAGGGSIVHAKEGHGKPFCGDAVNSGVVQSREGDDSEITCSECREMLP